MIVTKFKRNVNRNREADLETQYILRWAKKIRAIREFGGKCIHCGEMDNRVLVFHHINGKDYSINYLFGSRKSYDKLKTELDKCQLVCDRCHNIIHTGNSLIRKHNKKIIMKVYGVLKCECGYEYGENVSALEMHHIDQNTKTDKISNMIPHKYRIYENTISSKLLNELSGCKFMCSNCHAKSHIDYSKYSELLDKIISKSYNIVSRNTVNASEIVKLREAGNSIDEISGLTGASRSRVYELIRANNL